MRYLLLAVLVLLCMLLTACFRPGQKAREAIAEKMAENAVERASGGKADVDIQQGGKQVNIKTDQGEMQIANEGNGTLPEGWPANLPPYPGAAIKFGQRTMQGEKAMLQVVLETTDAVEKTLEFFDGKAAAAGFTQKMKTSMDQGGMRQYESDKQMLSVTASAADGKTTLSLMLMTK